MMTPNTAIARRLTEAVAAHAARERAWLPRDHHGRWVVMEPGAGRYLKDSPRAMRRYVDAITPRRGRRFSSLSRARAFARSVGGEVRRWRRTPPGGGVWQRVSPWERARSMAEATRWLPGMLCAESA